MLAAEKYLQMMFVVKECARVLKTVVTPCCDCI
jgi:hypothetical protein